MESFPKKTKLDEFDRQELGPLPSAVIGWSEAVHPQRKLWLFQPGSLSLSQSEGGESGLPRKLGEGGWAG